MDIDELCAAAWNGLVPEHLTIEQEVFCLRMIRLYERFKQSQINQDKAKLEKALEIKKYNDSVRMREFNSKKSLHTVAMWKDTECFISEYRKNRTLENADKLATAMEGKVHGWNRIEEGKG